MSSSGSRTQSGPPHGVRITHPFVEFSREEIEQSIPDRFEKQVARYPDRLAVKSTDGALTYDQLNRAANRLAHTILAERGESAEPVALLMDKGITLITTILAVLKSGRFFAPIDPAFPPARILRLLEDSRAGIVATDNQNVALVRRLAADRWTILNVEETSDVGSAKNPDLAISPRALACILYTSGSTGEPKGVVHTHRNLLHETMIYTNVCQVCADDRTTLLATHTVLGLMQCILSALLNGAAVVPFNLRTDTIGGLARRLRAEEITIWHSTPTVFRHFAGSLEGEDLFPRLRVIGLGGETISQRDVELCRKHLCPECLIVCAMGATESGRFTEFVIDRNAESAYDVVPLGHPVTDVTVLLLDEAGRPVDPGEIGEIVVKSAFLSPGYWQRPDLTEAAFYPAPEGGEERCYRTGDLGYLLPDGNLMHAGRKDAQLKVRGFRIEPAQIQSALAELPGVKEAVVSGQDDRSGEKRLVAYVVPSGAGTTTASIRSLLKERLPDYMVPSAFVLLDSLPLTPGGKLDRLALPTPDWRNPSRSRDFVPPRTPLEAAVAEIWAEVLGVDRVGIYDDFFELGGHSLLATRIVSRLGDSFKVGIPVASLFEIPTVFGQVALISRALAENMERPDAEHLLTELEGLTEDEAIQRLPSDAPRMTEEPR